MVAKATTAKGGDYWYPMSWMPKLKIIAAPPALRAVKGGRIAMQINPPAMQDLD
jgi:hypothetical protein